MLDNSFTHSKKKAIIKSFHFLRYLRYTDQNYRFYSQEAHSPVLEMVQEPDYSTEWSTQWELHKDMVGPQKEAPSQNVEGWEWMGSSRWQRWTCREKMNLKAEILQEGVRLTVQKWTEGDADCEGWAVFISGPTLVSFSLNFPASQALSLKLGCLHSGLPYPQSALKPTSFNAIKWPPSCLLAIY